MRNFNVKKPMILIVAALFLLFSLSTAFSRPFSEKHQFVADEVIVKFKENSDVNTLNIDNSEMKIHKKISRNEKLKSKKLDKIYLMKVKDVEKASRELRRNPNVEYAEPNYIVSIDLIPNDPFFSSLYGLHNTGQTGGTADADIDAPEAWNLQTGSSSVVVAVIDTGVDYNHPDLAQNIWTNSDEIAGNGIDDDNNGFIDDIRGWDFVSNDNNPFDDHGHGTHVSGTIGGVGSNGVGVAGVAWNIKIIPLKFLNSAGSGTTADAIEAIQYATANGAHIMSNSWGGGGFSQALMDAISAANAAGILFVAAAGNANSNNDVSPNYPSNYDVPNVVAVAATDHNDLRASFSNYGANTVHLGAPGVNTFSTVPNGSCSLCDSSGYKNLSGTSMATPHVSGAAGLIKAQFPALTSNGIKTRLLESVDLIPSMVGITTTGGRLNVFNALESTPDNIPPAAVIDLAANNPTFDSVALTWTATGDDGNVGTASTYDVRYSTLQISDANWDNATKAVGEPNPQVSGSTEFFTVGGLSHNTLYYFAMKVIDNLGNPSELSNLASGTTTNPTIIFEDNMENGLNGWTSTGLWHQETKRSYSPTKSWAYNTGAPNYNYDLGTIVGALTSPIIDLSAYNSAILTFRNMYQTETGTIFDRRWVQISVDGGIFQYVKQLSGEPMLVWNLHSLDLSPYTGHTIQIRFFFNTVDSLYNNYEGWYIDDVTVLAESSSPNNQPIANANGPYAGIEDVPVTFDGSGSFDADNDTLAYSWNFGDGGTGTGVNPSHTYSQGGNFLITLAVNDGQQNSAPSATNATITNVNDAPVANAGADKTAKDADGNNLENVLLNGNASFDVDGFITSYEWFENSIQIAVGTMPIVSFAIGTHAVELKVTDNEGAASTDNVIVTVNPNQAPSANAGADQSLTDSDGNGFEQVRLNGSSSFDSDGAIVSYEWEEGLNLIGTGAVLVSNLSVGNHILTLTVTDNGGLTSSDNVLITINPQGQQQRALLLYGEKPTMPSYRIVDNAIGSELSASSIGARPDWIELAPSPLSNEMAMATLDNLSDINVQIWNGNIWGSVVELATSSRVSQKAMDVGYESQSGRAVVVYTDLSGTTSEDNMPRYNIWGNGAWSAKLKANSIGAIPYSIELAPNPLRNEIIMVASDSAADINAQVWNGSSWSSVVELTFNASASGQPFDVSYETLSGDGLIVYTNKDTSDRRIHYRNVINGVIGAEQHGQTLGNYGTMYNLISNPNSDEIILMVLDSDRDTRILVWNGNSWSDKGEVSQNAQGTTYMSMDGAYDNSGRAILAYSTNTNVPKYRIWDGISLGAQQNAATAQDIPRWIKLASKPNSNELLMIMNAINNHADVQQWNGLSWARTSLSTGDSYSSRGGVALAFE